MFIIIRLFLLVIFSAFVLSINASQQQTKTEEQWDEGWGDSWDTPEEQLFHGFLEFANSYWLDDKASHIDEPMQESRLRLDWDYAFDVGELTTKTDLIHDAVIDNTDVKFREINYQFSPGHSTDIKLGRQILTWGTGDLVFINDLFPKDWQSFFMGRDDEYLKAPSDAIRFSWFGSDSNLDVVITPEFESDEYLSGERFSFYIPSIGISQPQTPIHAVQPVHRDFEIATRLFGTENGLEWALYGYRGFYKTPKAIDNNANPYFSRLNVWGASVRQAAFNGIVKFEIGQYLSLDDPGGHDPLVPNDEFRALIGYETELAKNLTGSFQFYLEKTQDYQSLINNSLTPEFEQREWHTQVTARITHQSHQQKWTNSFFVFYSPTDNDGHLRLTSDYRFNDEWKLSTGLFLFEGEKEHSFWGQLQQNSSVWMRLRYLF